MFVTNWNSTTKIQKISEITNFFRHYFLSRTEVYIKEVIDEKIGEYDAYIESMTEDYYHYQENDSIDNEDVMIDNLFATLE